MAIEFTGIHHNKRRALGVSNDEYVFLDHVYHLQVSPKSSVKNWCYKKKDKIADELGITKQGLYKMINRLIEKNLLVKDPDTCFIATTEKWYCAINYGGYDSENNSNNGKLSLQEDSKLSGQTVNSVYNSVNSVDENSKLSLQDTIYNKKINIENNNDAEKKIFSEQSQNETFDLEAKKNEGKEKSCAKKENVEKLPHPCDSSKLLGEYIEGHGDGELQNMLAKFYFENMDKYEPEMYKQFKAYWTALVQKGKDKGKEFWRTQKTFSLAGRLATWAQNYKPQQQQKQNGNRKEWNAEEVGLGAIAILRQRQQERAELKRQQQQTIINLQNE